MTAGPALVVAVACSSGVRVPDEPVISKLEPGPALPTPPRRAEEVAPAAGVIA